MIFNVRNEPRIFHARLLRFGATAVSLLRGRNGRKKRRGGEEKSVGFPGFGGSKYLRRTIIDCANPYGTDEQRSGDFVG